MKKAQPMLPGGKSSGGPFFADREIERAPDYRGLTRTLEQGERLREGRMRESPRPKRGDLVSDLYSATTLAHGLKLLAGDDE